MVQATLEWENQDDGFLAKILVGDGSKDIPVGTPVAVITDGKDDVSLAKFQLNGSFRPCCLHNLQRSAWVG